MKKKEFSIEINGVPLVAQFSDLADQADGSVILRYGNTTVLATAIMSHGTRDGLSYFPLTVDYEEKFYAAGAILGSRFTRREGRPSDEAILSGRAVDRTIRPLFDGSIRSDVQVVITILSLDEYDPDILAINAASLALLTSDIPWNGPVSAVRIGQKKSGEFSVNPKYTDRVGGLLDIDTLVCGKNGSISMIEVEAREVDENSVEAVFKKASEEIEIMQEFQNKIFAEIGKEKRLIEKTSSEKEMSALFAEHIEPKMFDSIFSGKAGKSDINLLKREWTTLVEKSLPPEILADTADYYEKKVDELVHKEAIENNKRPDGKRSSKEDRPTSLIAREIARERIG